MNRKQPLAFPLRIAHVAVRSAPLRRPGGPQPHEQSTISTQYPVVAARARARRSLADTREPAVAAVWAAGGPRIPVAGLAVPELSCDNCVLRHAVGAGVPQADEGGGAGGRRVRGVCRRTGLRRGLTPRGRACTDRVPSVCLVQVVIGIIAVNAAVFGLWRVVPHTSMITHFTTSQVHMRHRKYYTLLTAGYVRTCVWLSPRRSCSCSRATRPRAQPTRGRTPPRALPPSLANTPARTRRPPLCHVCRFSHTNFLHFGVNMYALWSFVPAAAYVRRP